MDRSEAIHVLTQHNQSLIRDVYDTYDNVQLALRVLYPSFEYPDWDYYTCAGFVEAFI